MINPDRDMKANFMMIAEIFEPEPKCSNLQTWTTNLNQ